MLRKIHVQGLYIDVAGHILICLMQILKVLYSYHCMHPAHSMYLDEAVINRLAKGCGGTFNRCMSKTC